MRATARRIISEVDNYFDKAIDPLTTQAFSKKPEERDLQVIADSRKATIEEFALFTRYLAGDFLVGPLSAADFAFYTLVAFVKRCEIRLPDLDADGMLTPEIRAWKARIEALPYFGKTIPPHWKAR
jgi:glutathione S-transferase